MLTRFYTKEGMTIKRLINDLVIKEKGSRIKSISEYCKELDVTRGTVQAGFRFLIDHDAIGIESKGRLGSYVTYIDKRKLIELDGNRKFIGVMPLPYSPLYQGLATGVFMEAKARNIDIQMAFMRGAESRISMLLEGNYDFVIMSRLSAEFYKKNYRELEIICNFGKGTYVKSHKLVLNNKTKSKNLKFGIDMASRDMEIITKHECEGKNIELVEMPYMQLNKKILNGDIDGAIMNYDTIKNLKLDLKFQDIDEEFFKGTDTEATLIAKKDNGIIRAIFQSELSVKNVIEIQEKVYNGTEYPIY